MNSIAGTSKCASYSSTQETEFANSVSDETEKGMAKGVADKGSPKLTYRDLVSRWKVDDVVNWATSIAHCSPNVAKCLQIEAIDGQVLLSLNEDDIRDFRYRLNYNLRFGEMKKLWLLVHNLQRLPTSPTKSLNNNNNIAPTLNNRFSAESSAANHVCDARCHSTNPSLSEPWTLTADYDPDLLSASEGCSVNIPPEFFKTAISLGYSFLVTWITSFVMVIVHERVPDMKRYPPLPDIFLDNVPHIPWAFHMCEITGTLLFVIWACVCIFHKYRMVLLRRFFALAGTVFLLRCVTMLITSLSVPGTHLQCNQNDHPVDDSSLNFAEALHLRITRAYTIWSGLGMSIQGVRTCGDYMFSGHTVALTLLNFFITEYTPRNLYFLHTLTWLLNMFGIFFILAAHEHYSIDVFVAFYITSRLFLYYHTLANNQALMSHDSNRTRIWFPMFSYFESSVDGIIPNEYDSIGELFDQLLGILVIVKDSFMMSAHRFWADPPYLPLNSRNLFFIPGATNATTNSARLRNAATSTTWSTNNTPTTAQTQLSQSTFRTIDSSGNVESDSLTITMSANSANTITAASTFTKEVKSQQSSAENAASCESNKKCI